METKQQLIERIWQERAGWEALLAEIGEERMTQPGAMEEWSFKDTLAHLITWWQRDLARLEMARHGERPPRPSDVSPGSPGNQRLDLSHKQIPALADGPPGSPNCLAAA